MYLYTVHAFETHKYIKNEMERNSNPAKLGKLMTLSDLSKR